LHQTIVNQVRNDSLDARAFHGRHVRGNGRH
jgi:hypothetical protein